MFGRLQISTTEAVEAYTEFSGSIFQEKKWRVQNGSYKATKLKEAFQKIIAKYSTSQHPDKIMLDTRETSCKTYVICYADLEYTFWLTFKRFVCAIATPSLRLTLFRTYLSRPTKAFDHCKIPIWGAPRATTAAPTFLSQ